MTGFSPFFDTPRKEWRYDQHSCEGAWVALPGYKHRLAYEEAYGRPADPDTVWKTRDAEQEMMNFLRRRSELPRR